jgi:hypothetical protein
VLVGASALLALPQVRAAVGDGAATLAGRAGYSSAVLGGTAFPVATEATPAAWHLSSILTGCSVTVAAVALAAAMTWHRSWAPLGVAGRVLARPLHLLHGVHRAHLGDDVSWVLVGVAVLGAAVLLQTP